MRRCSAPRRSFSPEHLYERPAEPTSTRRSCGVVVARRSAGGEVVGALGVAKQEPARHQVGDASERRREAFQTE